MAGAAKQRMRGGLGPDERRALQLERLLRAAGEVAVRDGAGGATAQAISQHAGMSKATFYEHFDNKDSCFEVVVRFAFERALGHLVEGARAGGASAQERQRAGLRAFLDLVEKERTMAKATMIEIMNASPRVVAVRHEMIRNFAHAMYAETERGARVDGGPRFASIYDAYGVVGAVVELTARHLHGGPEAPTLDEVRASCERLLFGVLSVDSTA